MFWSRHVVCLNNITPILLVPLVSSRDWVHRVIQPSAHQPKVFFRCPKDSFVSPNNFIPAVHVNGLLGMLCLLMNVGWVSPQATMRMGHSEEEHRQNENFVACYRIRILRPHKRRCWASTGGEEWEPAEGGRGASVAVVATDGWGCAGKAVAPIPVSGEEGERRAAPGPYPGPELAAAAVPPIPEPGPEPAAAAAPPGPDPSSELAAAAVPLRTRAAAAAPFLSLAASFCSRAATASRCSCPMGCLRRTGSVRAG
uniref:Uncharacterized protein n=1 Tax=Arundo donax TaxID=35708 RepID=A0A0A9H8U1_ARUDO